MKKLIAFTSTMLRIIRDRWSKSRHSGFMYCACGYTCQLGICPECGTESGAKAEDIQGLL